MPQPSSTGLNTHSVREFEVPLGIVDAHHPDQIGRVLCSAVFDLLAAALCGGYIPTDLQISIKVRDPYADRFAHAVREHLNEEGPEIAKKVGLKKGLKWRCQRQDYDNPDIGLIVVRLASENNQRTRFDGAASGQLIYVLGRPGNLLASPVDSQIDPGAGSTEQSQEVNDLSGFRKSLPALVSDPLVTSLTHVGERGLLGAAQKAAEVHNVHFIFNSLGNHLEFLRNRERNTFESLTPRLESQFKENRLLELDHVGLENLPETAERATLFLPEVNGCQLLTIVENGVSEIQRRISGVEGPVNFYQVGIVA